ncbi:unnamed protein product [Victoria cruziana]
MMRRKPTRIEMNMEEDRQELEEAKKKQQQLLLQSFPTTPTPANTLLHHLQGNKDSKHQRIGLSD